MSLGFILVLSLGSKVKTSLRLCHDVFDVAAIREVVKAGKWQRFEPPNSEQKNV